MFNVFHIPIKLIHTPSDSTSEQSKLAPSQPAGFTSWFPFLIIPDPCLYFIEWFRSINKQFSIDSLLDWEGHHWVFTCSHPNTYTHSSDYSTVLANIERYFKCKLKLYLGLRIIADLIYVPTQFESDQKFNSLSSLIFKYLAMQI